MLKTINEVSLARDLVRCQSVTPKDDGAINVVAKNLKKLGFKCQIMEFKEKGTPQIKNLYPCGEGAGYAGGIVSAAMDGQKLAQSIAAQLK